MKIINTRLFAFWESLQTSFWFTPSLMVFFTIGFSQLLLGIDQQTANSSIDAIQAFHKITPESARAILTTIAASMITVTSIAFSITVVALSLASSQFGPRLIRNFMMDTGTQCVLGFFVSTFIYCLIIIQATKSFGEQNYVPGISVFTSVVLAIIGVGVLIYFIHHVASAIQADNVIDRVYCELNEIIDRLFPDPSDGMVSLQLAHSHDLDQHYKNQQDILATRSNYLQTIDLHDLFELAKTHNIALDIYKRPGDFVVKDTPLCTAYFNEAHLPCDTPDITGSFSQGSHRTPVQDPEFAVRQLVEIAVRALSPGINDPYSAVTVVDKLSAVLCNLANRPFPSSILKDDANTIRVLCKSPTFVGMGDAAFNQIRQYGEKSVAVTIRLLEGLSNILHFSTDAQQRQFVSEQVSMIEQTQIKLPLASHDWQDINARLSAIKEQLKQRPMPTPIATQ